MENGSNSAAGNQEWRAPKSPNEIEVDKIAARNAEFVSPANTNYTNNQTESRSSGIWDKFKNYFKRDNTNADTIAKTDRISQEAAEFRAAGNILTGKKEKEDKALLEQIRRQNIGASEDTIQDLYEMRKFEGKDKDPIIIPSVENRSDVIDAIASKAETPPEIIKPDVEDGPKQETDSPLNQETENDENLLRAISYLSENKHINLSYKTTDGDKISFYRKDGQLMKSVLKKDGESWIYGGESRVSEDEIKQVSSKYNSVRSS